VTVFAVDPGAHTGIFYVDSHGQECSVLLDYTNHLTPHEHLYMWLMQMVDPQKDTVICESFEFRKEDAQNREYIDYSTGELVGAVALFCQLTGTKYVRQMAAQGKGFWNNDKLHRAGLFIRGKDAKHIRDATRHWLVYHTFGEGAKKDPDYAKALFLRIKK
jgi:hypothetical protein